MVERTGKFHNAQGPWATAVWLALSDTDTGSGVEIGMLDQISVQAVGNATTVALQGSNDGGVTWSALGAGLTLTIASGVTPVTGVTIKPLQIRPVATGGTNTAVYLFGSKRAQ